MGLKELSSTFLENGCTNFYYVLIIYGDHNHKYKFIGSMFRKITVHALGTPMRNVNFLDNGLTDIDSVLIICTIEAVDPNIGPVILEGCDLSGMYEIFKQ
jgi:hypothetical protein